MEQPAAGLARRAAAALVDLAIVVAAVLAWADILLGGLGRGWSMPATLGALVLYGFLCEGAFAGRTPGKALLGLAVVGADGGPPTPGAAFLRNLLRPVDCFPYAIPYGIGLATAIATGPRRQRIGDILAGTRVVRRAGG